jgi:hypothetical protein
MTPREQAIYRAGFKLGKEVARKTVGEVLRDISGLLDTADAGSKRELIELQAEMYTKYQTDIVCGLDEEDAYRYASEVSEFLYELDPLLTAQIKKIRLPTSKVPLSSKWCNNENETQDNDQDYSPITLVCSREKGHRGVHRDAVGHEWRPKKGAKNVRKRSR